jgi:hypothetical protein
MRLLYSNRGCCYHKVTADAVTVLSRVFPGGVEGDFGGQGFTWVC